MSLPIEVTKLYGLVCSYGAATEVIVMAINGVTRVMEVDGSVSPIMCSRVLQGVDGVDPSRLPFKYFDIMESMGYCDEYRCVSAQECYWIVDRRSGSTYVIFEFFGKTRMTTTSESPAPDVCKIYHALLNHKELSEDLVRACVRAVNIQIRIGLPI